jgi:hypothetical protein
MGLLALLEKIASGFWTTIWRIAALITPFFTQSRYLRGLGRGLMWVIHVFAVAAILAGLWWINHRYLNRMIKSPLLIRLHLEDFWLPVLVFLIYILSWLAYWLWKLLGPEEDLIEFPDIEEAWEEAGRALHQAGIEVTDAPLFFVLGRPQASEETLFQAAQLQLLVKQAPARPDAPLRVYASRDGIYITCAGASLMGRQAAILAGEASPTANGVADGVVADDGDDAFKTLQPKGRLKDVQGVLARAREMGRDPGQLTDAEKEEIRALLAEEKAEEAQRQKGPRPNLLKNAQEVEWLTARLRYLCRLIVRDRKPYCPLNGILLLVPFGATDTEEDASQSGAVCQHDLATVRKGFQVSCPTFALVCDLETAAGFREFMERFPMDQRQRRLGQRLPLAPDLHEGETVSALVDRGSQWVCNTLFPTYIYRLFRIESEGREDVSTAVNGNVRLYQLLCQMRERQTRLSRMLTRAISVGDGRSPVLFGGCYIAGTGREPSREQAFIAGVFRRLIENQNFVSWTAEAMEEETKFESWTKYGYLGIGIFTAVVVLILVYVFGIKGGA